MHTSAYVSAYVSMRQQHLRLGVGRERGGLSEFARMHTSAYVSAYVSMRQQHLRLGVGRERSGLSEFASMPRVRVIREVEGVSKVKQPL
jgi:hypothetical protein